MLNQQMERAPVPLRFGTLVVFTDGTDRAPPRERRGRRPLRSTGRASRPTSSPTARRPIVDSLLEGIGRSGTFVASQNRADIQKGF